MSPHCQLLGLALLALQICATAAEWETRSSSATPIVLNGDGDNFNLAQFGNYVVEHDGLTYIAANGHDIDGTDRGSVSIYDSLTEAPTAQILGAAARDFFGTYLVADGSELFFGAVNASSTGAVYIFDIDNDYAELAVLRQHLDDQTDGAFFGDPIVVSDDYVAVAARFDSRYVKNGGSVTVFERGGSWDEIVQLNATNTTAGSTRFGFSMAMDEEWLLVGVTATVCATGSNCGTVFVYRVGSFDLDRQLAPPVPLPGPNTQWGRVVAIEGSVTLISALFLADPDSGCPTTRCGSVWVYRTGEWSSPVTSLFPPDGGADNDRFGQRLSVNARAILIGAYGTPGCVGGTENPPCQRAYLFFRDGPDPEDIARTEGWILTDSVVTPNFDFGFYTAIADDGTLMVTSRRWGTCPANEFCGRVQTFPCSRCALELPSRGDEFPLWILLVVGLGIGLAVGAVVVAGVWKALPKNEAVSKKTAEAKASTRSGPLLGSTLARQESSPKKRKGSRGSSGRRRGRSGSGSGNVGRRSGGRRRSSQERRGSPEKPAGTGKGGRKGSVGRKGPVGRKGAAGRKGSPRKRQGSPEKRRAQGSPEKNLGTGRMSPGRKGSPEKPEVTEKGDPPPGSAPECGRGSTRTEVSALLSRAPARAVAHPASASDSDREEEA